MTTLIVIACVLLLLIGIMLLPLKLFFQLENEDLNLHFGVLMFKLKLYPKKIKKAGKEMAEDVEHGIEEEQESVDSDTKTVKPDVKSRKAKNNASSSSDQTAISGKKKSSGQKKEQTEERTWKETFFLMIDIVHSVVRPTQFMLRHVKITDFSLHAVVGGEEPDETAIRFGHWNAAVYGGLATLRNFLTIKCKKINIAVDFTAPETQVSAEGILKIQVFVVVFAAVRMFFNLLVNTFKRAKENEETVNQAERKAAA
ncbi:MAG: hypothetical protein PUB00_09345 [Clostridiales bacterium]|nr:hypothetical protein [Clostridiales bacterium]